MPLSLEPPIIYLVTSGETRETTTPASEEFSGILTLTEAAVAAKINLLQLREKNLSARNLYTLVLRTTEITRGSAMRLLVNDRADIAMAAGADGVHLTSQSLPASVIRGAFGTSFVAGVSTHTLEEAVKARDSGADFVVFGPIFETASKKMYGRPVGTQKLSEVTGELGNFPVLGIGGITLEKCSEVFSAGAAGIAAIGLFNDPEKLKEITAMIRSRYVATSRR